jgi:undecaprenyl diphosphate synthase
MSQTYLPRHVVVIPDGNRRWAQQKNKTDWQGHKAGAENLENILKYIRDINLPCFSFWGMSKDNFTRRSKVEVAYLLKLFKSSAQKLLKQSDIYDQKIRVNFLGVWPKLFPKNVAKPFYDLIESTKNHNNRFLNFLICYNGKDEMVNAVQSIVKQAQNKKIKITEKLIKENLWTKDLPPVDLVIRTGVESDPHLSAGLLMWDTADTQLYFTETPWPSFNEQEFAKALEDFSKRERRFGK